MAVLAVLLVVVVVLGFFGLVIALVLWAQHANKRRMERWARVAAELGLSYVDNTVSGVLDGQHVKLWVKVVSGSENNSYYTVVSGLLDPGMDLGLSLYREGILARAALGLLGHRDIHTGDPTFDPAFIVRADEPQRAVLLLTPELRGALIELAAQSGTALSLGDAGCELERNGICDDERWMIWALRTAARLTRLMNRARRSLPPASALVAHKTAWQRLATAAGFRGMDTPLCMWGKLEGFDIWVYCVRVAPLDFRVESRVRFATPIHANLVVRRAQTLDAVSTLFGGQDLELGDPAFDRAFLVRASRPDAAALVLDAEVRQRMLHLNERIGQVEVSDEGVLVRSVSLSRDPHQAMQLMEAARDLAHRIVQRARPLLHAGPYR
jgi:hypothetical protein